MVYVCIDILVHININIDMHINISLNKALINDELLNTPDRNYYLIQLGNDYLFSDQLVSR